MLLTCSKYPTLQTHRPKLYQFRYNPSSIRLNQDKIHTVTIRFELSTPLQLGAIPLAGSVNTDTSYQLRPKCHTGTHA